MKQGVRSSGARCVHAVRTVQSTFRASPSSLLSTHSARRPQPGPAACPPSQGSASPEPRGSGSQSLLCGPLASPGVRSSGPLAAVCLSAPFLLEAE